MMMDLILTVILYLAIIFIVPAINALTDVNATYGSIALAMAVYNMVRAETW